MYTALIASLCQCVAVSAFHAASSPPLLDVPVFSLSTLGHDDDESSTSKSTMNILTYASPVSIKPHRMWSISLYKGTMSHENFKRERRGVLQMLQPEHARCRSIDQSGEADGELIRVLGGSSARDVDKRAVCKRLGYAWENLPQWEDDMEEVEWPHVLPSCVYYLKLELVGDLIDCGSHDVALCKVVSMVTGKKMENTVEELDYLSTRELRDINVISKQGRVIQLDGST